MRGSGSGGGGVAPVEGFDGDDRGFSEPAMLGPGTRSPRGGKGSRAKRRRRRNIIIAGIAVFIMLTGGGLVGGTYFFDNVNLPADTPLEASTMIYYSDGTTVMAKVGEVSRTVLADDQIPKGVKEAVVATEDNSFYTNKGVDYKGIARAAWNNLTGGERQGASTISQQYARQIADLKGISYARKLREAVIARKLNSAYTKDHLISLYLNTVYFGRHAYGIEAAAQAYYGRSVKDLTIAEGMVLAGIIKDPSGPGALGSTYDPTVHPETAIDRFTNYIKPNMVKLGFISAQDAAAMKYPSTVQKFDPAKDAASREQVGLDKPTGLIVHHVMDEISKIKNADGTSMFTEPKKGGGGQKLKSGGLKIVTTIDKNMEDAAITAASGRTKDSPLFNQPPNLQGALVAVEGGTGRVKAYYGGPGNGTDYAGVYQDPVLSDGAWSTGGAHPPGSSMKIYTLLAGLREGYKIDSYWDGSDVKEFPKSDRIKKPPKKPVSNSHKANCLSGSKQECMLWEATEQSLNTPFFGLTETIGAAKVIELAHAAGIRSMWATEKVGGKVVGVRKDLDATPISQLSPQYFSTEVGIGQYPITVMDQANGASILATRGKASKEHFIQQVYAAGKLRYAESVVAKQIDGLTPDMVDNANWALEKVVKEYHLDLANGRQSAGKTGTWELSDGNEQSNGHAWFAGATAQGPKSPGLSAAVWVGNKDDEKPLTFRDGTPIIGGKMAGPIWQKFMNLAISKGTPLVSMPDQPKDIGDKIEGNGIAPPAGQQQFDPNNPNNPNNTGDPGTTQCLIPALCPGVPNAGNNNGNNGNNNGNGNGNNNGNGNGGRQ